MSGLKNGLSLDGQDILETLSDWAAHPEDGVKFLDKAVRMVAGHFDQMAFQSYVILDLVVVMQKVASAERQNFDLEAKTESAGAVNFDAFNKWLVHGQGILHMEFESWP